MLFLFFGIIFSLFFWFIQKKKKKIEFVYGAVPHLIPSTVYFLLCGLVGNWVISLLCDTIK